MIEKRKLPLIAFEVFRDAVPRILTQLQRVEEDASKAIVWVVGLASTLLVLGLSDAARVKQLLADDYKFAVACLLTAVIVGVTYRILSLWVSAIRTGLLLRFENYLVGYRATLDSHIPPKLSDSWDVAEIVRRLHVDFGVDYDFLRKYNTPIEECRDAYKSQYELSARLDRSQMETLKAAVAAHNGLTAAEAAALFEPESGETLRKVHRKAMIVRVLNVFNACFFATAGAAFVTAMVYIARALWRA